MTYFEWLRPVRAEWAQSLADFPRQQAEEAERRGMPGKEVMQAYIESVEEAGVDWPVDYSLD